MNQRFDEQFLAFQTALAGRYSIERELGRGGMGIVYLAREVRLDRPVAIKLLPPSLASAELRDGFLREARTAAKLSHPHVIPIFAVEEVAGFVFFAMAYVEGATLSARVRSRGPMAPSDAARMLREIAWALAYAHEQGVIHRDVKPDNILLEDGTGRALVADFGIASLTREASSPSGQIIGTPEFMSPEQAAGRAVDHRSDLYALGGVAFYALTGCPPFDGTTVSEVLARKVTQPAPPVASLAPGVPRRIAQLVDQCLLQDPAQRPASAAQFGDHLSRTLDQRKDLPVALRAFVKHDSRIDGPIVMLVPSIVTMLSVAVSSTLQSDLAGFAFLAAGIVLPPAAVLITRARRLLKAGFRHGDLEVAFRTELERGREERTFAVSRAESRLERLLKLGGVVGVATGIIAGMEALGAADPTVSVTIASTGFTVGILSFFGQLTLLQRRRDIDTEFWGWLWTRRVGRWMFGIARGLLSKKAIPAAMTHRPTELVIAMAAEQLFEELPREARKELHELPDVMSRLESDARKMRERLAELQETGIDDVLAGPGGRDERAQRIVAALRAERSALQQRLADAVTAMETIRLSLLHLHAGKVGVESLTTQLEQAREIAAGVDRLMEGAREVEAFLKPASTPVP